MVVVPFFIAVIYFNISSTQIYSTTIYCYNTGAVSCNSSLAVNSYTCTCTVSVDAGNISPGCFTKSSRHIAIDNVFNSPFVAVLRHGQVAVQLDFGIAVSINTINIVMAMSLNSDIAVNNYCSLLTSAVCIDADC